MKNKIRLHSWLYRHATLLFFLFMAGGLAGILWIETPYNAAFDWVVRWLALPVAAISGWIVLSGWHYYRHENGLPLKSILLGALAVPALVLLFSAGYVNVLNAAFPTAEQVTYRGTVKSIWVPRRSFEDLRVTFLLDQNQGEQTLYVRRSQQGSVHVGGPYAVRMTVGCLGFPFEPVWPFDGK